jgi:hypothetical protein
MESEGYQHVETNRPPVSGLGEINSDEISGSHGAQYIRDVVMLS